MLALCFKKEQTMSRYIDADALKYYGNHLDDKYEAMYHDAQWVYRFQIDSAPSIDIVRCRECKYYEAKEDWCYWRDEAITAYDFCSYGEREGE